MDYKDKEIKPSLSEDLRKIIDNEKNLILEVHREDNRVDLVRKNGVKSVLKFLENDSNILIGTRIVVRSKKDIDNYVEIFRSR